MNESRNLKKQTLTALLGLIAFCSFLVICSETMPGDQSSEWSFAWPKFVALAIGAASVWGIHKLDGYIKR